MKYKIEIKTKDNLLDVRGKEIKKDILDLGILDVKNVNYSHLYCIEGEIDQKKVDDIINKLLIDPVTQDFAIFCITDDKTVVEETSKELEFIVEVYYKKGVTDNVGDSIKKGILDLDIKGISHVQTGHKYIIKGDLINLQVSQISKKLLANTIIQNFKISKTRDYFCNK